MPDVPETEGDVETRGRQIARRLSEQTPPLTRAVEAGSASALAEADSFREKGEAVADSWRARRAPQATANQQVRAPAAAVRARARSRASELAETPCIGRAAFARLVRDISEEFWSEPGQSRRFSSHALAALQTASEAWMTGLMQDCALVAASSVPSRRTVLSRDFLLVRRLRRSGGDVSLAP